MYHKHKRVTAACLQTYIDVFKDSGNMHRYTNTGDEIGTNISARQEELKFRFLINISVSIRYLLFHDFKPIAQGLGRITRSYKLIG